MQTNGDKAPGLAQAPGRYSVQEAADLLGTTVEGVRSRVKRGTLDSLRVEGKVYILLGGAAQASDQAPGRPDDQARPDHENHDLHVHQERDGHREGLDHAPRADELIAELRAEVAAWREESRRKDHIIAALVERLPPQLEAPQTAAEEPEGAEPRPATEGAQEGSEQRSWWRRWFGG